MDDVTGAREGRFSAEFDAAFGTSFKAGTEIYRKRYAKESVFKALETLLTALPEAPKASPTVVSDETSLVAGQRVRLVVSESQEVPPSTTLASVALRWLIHHSYLRRLDERRSCVWQEWGWRHHRGLKARASGGEPGRMERRALAGRLVGGLRGGLGD